MNSINCKEACVNGCVLGDKCPHLPYLAETKKFLETTSIDRMLQIAADRFKPKT
jgi:hypothetical protein